MTDTTNAKLAEEVAREIMNQIRKSKLLVQPDGYVGENYDEIEATIVAPAILTTLRAAQGDAEPVAKLERTLSGFLNDHGFGNDPPEDSREWRDGYMSAKYNLREALKPWKPLGKPLDLSPLYAAPQQPDVTEAYTRVERRPSTVRKVWKVKREVIQAGHVGDDFKKAFPKWLHEVSFFGYAEQGWSAQHGRKKVASGEWGDEIWLLSDGSIGCNEYPFGWSAEAAIEKGRLKWEFEKAALAAQERG